MPRSEAYLDAPVGLRRVRLPGFTDSVRGVRFRDGVALDPMPAHVVETLRGIGLRVEDLGPWDPPAPAPPLAAADSSPSPPPTSRPSGGPVPKRSR